MNVLFKCFRHKYQVKYVSQAPLTRLFFQFNRHHLELIMDQEQIFKYVDYDYDPDSYVEILAVYENLIHTSGTSLTDTPISWFNNSPGLAGWFATRPITVSSLMRCTLNHKLSPFNLN